MSTCAVCGRPVEGHDRHVRFRLPDPVLQVPERDERQGTWKTDQDPNAAVMMMVPDVGAFVRALLPVRLTGGYTVTFGVWIGVPPTTSGGRSRRGGLRSIRLYSWMDGWQMPCRRGMSSPCP
jgi:hypothetical protein